MSEPSAEEALNTGPQMARRNTEISSEAAFVGGLGMIASLVGCAVIVLAWREWLAAETTVDLRRFERVQPNPWPSLFMASAFLAATMLAEKRLLLALSLTMFVFLAGTAFAIGGPHTVCAVALSAYLALHLLFSLRKSLALAAFFLAGIGLVCALPFFEYSGRALVSRAKSDMRSLATAIRAYQVDYDQFPPWTDDPRQKVFWHSESPMPTFQARPRTSQAYITTPISYITSLYPDPLRYLNESRGFAYWALEDAGFVLIGAGPNCVFDVDPKRLTAIQSVEELKRIDTLFVNDIYDPTNGTRSAGDVWRIEY